MATWRWLDRLRTSMDAQPEVDPGFLGRPVNVSLASDMRHLSSREGYPRSWWTSDQGSPAAGLHRTIGISTTQPAMYDVAINWLVQNTGAQVLVLMTDAALDSFTWAAGPTAQTLLGDDEGQGLLTVVNGAIATANLPTPNTSLFSQSSGFSHPRWPWRDPPEPISATVLLWNGTAAQALNMSGICQAIRR